MKIVVIGGLDTSLIHFRGRLLQAFVAAGHEVVAAAPQQHPEVPEMLRSIGVRFRSIPLSRAGLNLVRDAISLYCIWRLLRREKPDVVLSYTIKPVIYGSLAARIAGVENIYSLITGLGSAFYVSGFKGGILRAVVVVLYRISLKGARRVIVQNADISSLFIREKIASAQKLSVVSGSGVDTAKFPLVQVPAGAAVFLFVGRLLKDKGVHELVGAARVVKARYPDAKIVLVGEIDSNPASCSAREVEEWAREGVVECVGVRSDVRPFLRECTVFVLPSYHEGLPRSVLEAMATGRAIITTDTVGCRDTIFDYGPPDAAGIRIGSNGLLVPVRSTQALASAMIRLAADPALCTQMGAVSRSLVEQRFEVECINRKMMKEMFLE